MHHAAPARWLASLGLFVLLGAWPAARPALTQAPAAGVAQAMDEDFARSVKEWTTAPEFSSPLVDHLPLAKGIPTPRDVLGYHVGTPKRLTKTAEALAYYRALEKASPRVRVTTIGRTDEGRDVTVVYIASEPTMKQLDTHIANLGRLADPRGLSEADALRLVAATRPIYHLMAGLHSGETGPPEMLMELAYRLVASDTPMFRQIRERLIVSFTPASDPDGRDRYVDWYRKHMVDISEEKDRISGPPYWGKYIFHDNNRDINYSQVTMRAHLEWYLKTHPPVMHDLHESVPFLYTFSGQAPHNPNLDPIVYGELPMFANFEMAQLTKYGMPGVWTHGFVDMWSPGYLAFMSSNHNGLVRMYETFGNGGATTMKRRVAPPDGGAGQTSREWYRPLPPYREVTWSMRNNTNYMQTAVLSALQYASSFPDVLVENFYRKSRNSLEAGRKEAPHAYVVPAGQKDHTRVALLLTLLQRQGIEISRTDRELKLTDGTYAAGSFVIGRAQPYGRLLKTLLDKQTFPDPSLRTYDDTGWTMGLMLQVEVKPTADKAVLDAPLTLTQEFSRPGAVDGAPSPAVFVVAHHGSNDMVRLRLALGRDADVQAASTAFTVGDVTYPAGSFLVPASATALRPAVTRLGLSATGLATRPEVTTVPVDLPRLAMFSTWGRTQEVGWVRHAFDTFGIPYDLIYKERVREGNLRSAYDVLLVPNQATSGKSLVYDVERKSGPLAYRQDAQFPSLGLYGASDDITGGMGLEGVLELQKFVEGGGVLITLGGSSYMPAEFGLQRTVTATRPTGVFYAPGPIVQVELTRPEHPIFFGYQATKLPVRYANGPLFQVPSEDEAQVLMRYTGGDEGVMSGLMRGATEIRRRPALLDTPLGRGRIVAFATNPCYRWQNHGEFTMLFNAAVLFWNDVPSQARKGTN